MRTLHSMEPGQWASDAAPKGYGRLLARKLPTGYITFYFRYVRNDGIRDTLKIGMYDEAGRTGLTLAGARDQVAKLLAKYVSGDRDLRSQSTNTAAQVPAGNTAGGAAIPASAPTGTLGQLLDGYANQLESNGKESSSEVRSALQRHVRDAWPDFWKRGIAAVSTDDLPAVIAKVAETGQLRSAEKLRAYIRAAYSAAIRARHDARAVFELRDLRVTSNTAHDLASIKGANRARDHWLSIHELRHYWNHISTLPGTDGASLRFHLLTGCQRVRQLSCLTTADLDPEGAFVVLHDIKGRREQPRIHVVPLLPAARDALSAMHGGALGAHLFTVTGGVHGAPYKTVSEYLKQVACQLEKDGKTSAGFTPGDLRRTVETRLADIGVPDEVRAHLQSHGLGGVQNRHYNRYEYFREKSLALQLLFQLVTLPIPSAKSIRWNTELLTTPFLPSSNEATPMGSSVGSVPPEGHFTPMGEPPDAA